MSHTPLFRTAGILAASLLMVRLGHAQEGGLPARKESVHQSAVSTEGIQRIKLTGRLVCLVEEMHALYGTEVPSRHQHVLGFKTHDGKYFMILRTQLSEALFADPRLKSKELLLSVRLLPKSQIIDVVTIKSIKDGRVYDLYYYCFVCAIRTVSGGPCMCCQHETELQEVPLEQPAP